MRALVGCNYCQVPFCCGVFEIGDFTEDANWDISATGETTSEAYRNLLLKLGKSFVIGFRIQVWFARRYGDEEYRNDELKDLVSKIKGVTDLGEGRNPNSGNTIHGYIWTNGEELEFNE